MKEYHKSTNRPSENSIQRDKKSRAHTQWVRCVILLYEAKYLKSMRGLTRDQAPFHYKNSFQFVNFSWKESKFCPGRKIQIAERPKGQEYVLDGKLHYEFRLQKDSKKQYLAKLYLRPKINN